MIGGESAHQYPYHIDPNAVTCFGLWIAGTDTRCTKIVQGGAGVVL